MEVTAPHWHESVAKYKKNGGTEQLKKFDYTSYDDNIPYYTMIIKEDGRKIKLLLDLTEEMLTYDENTASMKRSILHKYLRKSCEMCTKKE